MIAMRGFDADASKAEILNTQAFNDIAAHVNSCGLTARKVVELLEEGMEEFTKMDVVAVLLSNKYSRNNPNAYYDEEVSGMVNAYDEGIIGEIIEAIKGKEA